MIESKHTPTPWHKSAIYPQTLEGPGDRPTLSTSGYSRNTGSSDVHAENEANFEFVYRACNAHDALVEALEKALDLVDLYAPADLLGGTAHTSIRAALALAKGE